MAISKQGGVRKIKDHDGQTFDIYNGDWEALQEITKKWNLKDESSTLRFAIAVLFKADTDKLYINGEPSTPSKVLLKGIDDNKK